MTNRTKTELSRRHFLGASASAGVAGVVGLGCYVSGSDGAEGVFAAAPNTEASLEDNVYTRLLGIKPHLGAHEHITRLGGSRMPPEVIQAMVEANDYFVELHELTEAAGRRVAEIMGAEDALVTAGAFSAMILGAAACLTGTDAGKVDALPHPTWPRRECLIQSEHRFSYDRAYRAAGMSIVEFDDREDASRKISENAAMIAVLTAVEKQSEFGPPIPKRIATPHADKVLMPEELIEIGKQTGVPVLVDMASDLPPIENLTRFVKAGADLVVISGGKGIRGPQSTGILAGRQDLIEAARLHHAPNGNIGRGMKVGKEEIVGLVVALERFVSLDHRAVPPIRGDGRSGARPGRRAHRVGERPRPLADFDDALPDRLGPRTAGFPAPLVSWDSWARRCSCCSGSRPSSPPFWRTRTACSPTSTRPWPHRVSSEPTGWLPWLRQPA